MTPTNVPTPATRLGRWRKKFADAVRGIGCAWRQESSFWVHTPVAVAVASVGLWLDLAAWRWAVLALCVTMVLAAELFNSAIERLARQVTQQHALHVREALDMASGAVLVTAAGAAIVGLIVLGPPLSAALGW